MRYQHLAVDARAGVVRLRLSGSPLCLAEARELSLAASELVEDRSVRVVVLESAGPDFCAGAASDLDPLRCGVNPPAELSLLRVPVIAALSGGVHSVGFEIALVADVRIASSDVSFSMHDIAAGNLPCWGGTQRLPRAVGRSTALGMLVGGFRLDAQAALEAGLVHEVAELAELGKTADNLIGQLTALGPIALEYAKEAVSSGAELSMRDGLRIEADLNNLLAAASTDRAEGLSAFFEKRPPRFTGR